MENFDRENIDELLKFCQIRQYFALLKLCAIQYHIFMMCNTTHACNPFGEFK